jgi:predicted permease
MPTRSPSTGVTAAATYAILCCSSAFLIWGFVLLSFLNSPRDNQGQRSYEHSPVTFLVVMLVPPAVIAAGIQTAIGLLHLKPWARQLSAFWAAASLALCLAIIAFRPYETFVIPQHFVRQSVLTRQMIAVSFILMLFPVSVWWLFYFRTKSVKEQFKRGEESGLQTETAKEG